MKLNKICAASAVLALAVALTACGGSASTAASSTASSEAASSVAASSEAASSEAAAESAEYTVYNTTGSTVSELYLYEAGSEDKGGNLAGEAVWPTARMSHHPRCRGRQAGRHDLCSRVHHRGRQHPELRDPALRDHSHLSEERGRNCWRYPHRIRCS